MNEQGHNEVRVLVAQNIRRERLRQGISLRKFALMIDVSYSYLCNIENAKRAVTIDVLDKIACGLGVDIAELFKRN